MPPLSPLTLSGFFNGMLEVFEPEALNCYTLFRPTPLTLSVSRNPILTHRPLSGFLDFALCKAFAAAHRCDEDRQAYISASRCTLSVIAKAKAWQTTCSSLSPKSNPKSVNSLLHYIAGSSSSFPSFPNCSSPRESASVYAAYLRSHFSVSQTKALRSRARGYFSELR